MTQKMVFDIAREHVNAGVEGLDAVMKATHSDLKELYPDVTEREVRDAFSDYGKTKFPSREEDLSKLREYRRLAQLVSAIEDARSKQAPKKTGTQRDKPTQAIREKMRELTKAMRENGIETTSPEEQLASTNQARATSLRNQIEDLEKQIRGGEKPTKAAPLAETPEVKALRDKRDDLRKQLQAIEDAKHPPKSPEDIALERYKKAITKRLAKVENRISAGDYTRPVKKTTKLDPKATKLRADYQRATAKWRSGLMKAEAAKRPWWEKGLDLLNGIRRMFVLSGLKTLAKLGAYSVTKLPVMAAGEVVGGGISKVPGISQVARRAPSEGGGSARALAKAYAGFFTKGFVDAAQALTKGKSNLRAAFGPVRAELPRQWHEFFALMHEVEKSPLRRSQFELSLQHRMEHAIRNRVDVTDGPTLLSLSYDAYADSNRALLLENNRLASSLRQMFRSWEAKNKATGATPVLGKIAAVGARAELPILTVPLNFARQTLEAGFGLPMGAARTVRAWYKGWDNLSPVEADSIMRNFKNGIIGGAVGLYAFLDGYYGWNHFGGYYQPGEKRSSDDAGFGRIRLGDSGFQLPTFLLHNPIIENGMLLNTIGRLMSPNRGEKAQEIPAAVVASLFGLTEHSPLGTSATKYSEMVSGYDREKAINEHLAGYVLPQFAKDVAGFGDTEKRAPKTLEEQIMMGIPGARQNVPVKEPDRVPRHISRPRG